MGSTIENITGLDVSNNSATDKALRAQRDAAGASNAMAKQTYDQTREDLAGYRAVGQPAVSSLASGNFMGGWQQDPGYQFRMQEGMKAIQSSAAAKGGLNSGATLKALSNYGQQTAAEEYGNIYNREFGRLSTLANIGQNSAAQTGAAAQNYSNAFAQNTQGAANAQAAAGLAQSQQTSGLIGSGITALAFSDERLKTNVRPVALEDLRELRKAIKPKHFRYVSEGHGEGDWVGVMAQDLEKSKLGRLAVSEDQLGRKKVNFQKLLSMLVASFAEGVE